MLARDAFLFSTPRVKILKRILNRKCGPLLWPKKLIDLFQIRAESG